MRGRQRALEQDVLDTQPAGLQVLPHLEAQLVHVERLGEVVRRAEPQRLDRGLGGGVGRHHQGHDVPVAGLGLAQHLHAVDVRQTDVGQQQVEDLVLKGRDGLAAVGGHVHVVAVLSQHDAQHVAHRRLIVHDEHARVGRCLSAHAAPPCTVPWATVPWACGRATGKWTDITVPAPGSERTLMRPP